MSPRLRMLRTILGARERLRDVAASHVAAAAQTQDQQTRALSGETAALEAANDAAASQLMAARTVHDLQNVTEEIAEQTTAVRRASARAEEARVATVRATAVMQEKEREVRRAERLVDREGKVEAKQHAKLEQYENDEITAARWKGPS